MAHDQIVDHDYNEEKRRLENKIKRDNNRNASTQKMIDIIYGDVDPEDLTPKP